MDDTVAHLVHTEGVFPNPTKLSPQSQEVAKASIARRGSVGPSVRYQRHLNRFDPPAETATTRTLSLRFVTHRGGVVVERRANNGRTVRNGVPFRASEVPGLNIELDRATAGALHVSKATREVRRVLSSRLAFAKSRATHRARTCTLTLDDLSALYDRQGGMCAVTGLPMDTGPDPKGDERWRKPFRVSLDRIDSTKGYEPENVRLVCAAVNNALGAWGEGVFAILAAAFLCNRRPLSSVVERRVHIADVVGSTPTAATVADDAAA